MKTCIMQMTEILGKNFKTVIITSFIMVTNQGNTN